LILPLDLQEISGLIEHRCDFGILDRHHSSPFETRTRLVELRGAIVP
jgi:hypothetical protein